MLCYRCEHRLRFLEYKQPRPRYQCGTVEESVGSCYMFAPQRPIVVERNDEEDPRPLSAGYMSCRYHMVEERDDAVLTLLDDGTLYWALP